LKSFQSFQAMVFVRSGKQINRNALKVSYHRMNLHVFVFTIFQKITPVKTKLNIQSSYFQKTEVSIHVSIIYRHRIQELDGQSDSDDESDLIEEQFFVISPDQVHDHNFSHEVQRQISEYLQTINANVKTMHEFTDGCAS
jgi:hypothetical protein